MIVFDELRAQKNKNNSTSKVISKTVNSNEKRHLKVQLFMIAFENCVW